MPREVSFPTRRRRVRKVGRRRPRFADGWMNLRSRPRWETSRGDPVFRVEALKYDPENVRLLTMLGSAYRDIGQADKGQPYLDKAARLGHITPK